MVPTVKMKVIPREKQAKEGMSQVVDTVPQEPVSTHEEEVIRKGQEERRELSHGSMLLHENQH